MDNAFTPAQINSDANVAEKPQERQRESIFLGAHVTFEGALTPLNVRVRNISSGGMMIDSTAKLEKGHPVSADIKGIGKVLGYVAWATDTRIGIAFNAPVDPKLTRQQIKNEAPPLAYNKPYIHDRRPGLAIR
jgi:PilZ domain